MSRQQQHNIHSILLVLLCILCYNSFCLAFSSYSSRPISTRCNNNNNVIDNNISNTKIRSTILSPKPSSTLSTTVLFGSDNDSNDLNDTNIWSPLLRRIVAGTATIGIVETGYLTYSKLFPNSNDGGIMSSICGVDGGTCNDVLNGPYSTIPYTSIPLSTIGLLAYSIVFGLAITPLFNNNNNDDVTIDIVKDDSDNRIFLTTITTAMATFSIFLMFILFNVLQTTCPFCILSACLSISLATITWGGRCLPNVLVEEGSNSNGGQQQNPMNTIGGGIAATTLVAMTLFFGNVNGSEATSETGITVTSSTTTLVAAEKKQQQQQEVFSPPTIQNDSSERAMKVATELEKLNAKMYGAYWCSHCYDQKETLGKQAFNKIQYIECSKDGLNSKSKICKSNKVPGYPTWEINGEQYPGEVSLEELEDLVTMIKLSK